MVRGGYHPGKHQDQTGGRRRGEIRGHTFTVISTGKNRKTVSAGLRVASLNNFRGLRAQRSFPVVWYLALGCFGQGNSSPGVRVQ